MPMTYNQIFDTIKQAFREEPKDDMPPEPAMVLAAQALWDLHRIANALTKLAEKGKPDGA